MPKCQCPQCHHSYDLQPAMQGKRVKCSKCKTVFAVSTVCATDQGDQGDQIDLNSILEDLFTVGLSASESSVTPASQNRRTTPDRWILNRLCSGMIIAGCLFILAYPVQQYRVLSVAGEAIEKIFEASEKLQTEMGQLPGANPPARDNLQRQVTRSRMRREANQAFFWAMTLSILAAVGVGGTMVAGGMAGKMLIDLELSIQEIRDSLIKD